MTSKTLRERIGEKLRFRVEGDAEPREGTVERVSADGWVVISGIAFPVEQISEAAREDARPTENVKEGANHV